MSVTWVTPAGDLGTLEERITVNINLQATSTSGTITYSVIAGSLPIGLLLDSQTGTIKGTPGEVVKFTESRFVVRAYDGIDEKDRTFKLSVDGSDFPEWITEEGFLNVGPGEAYFVLDDALVDFNLQATDTDLVAGDTLEYYIVPNSGSLPPGLTLSKEGNIKGFTKPVAAIDYNTNPTGAYDTHSFDTVPLDIAKNTSTGFDTYFYDNVTYDLSENSQTPRRLSRIYTFGVAVTDGRNAVQRVFKIYVVTTEFLQADNSLLQVDTNLFQADSSRDRQPLWITDAYLGRYRANNYVTLKLDVYDPPTLSGTITYFLLDENLDGSQSRIPPGLELDSTTGDLAGKVPYQAAITQNYKFTMQAVNFPLILANTTYTLVGDWSSTRTYIENEAVRYAGFIYVNKSTHRNLLPDENPEVWELGVSTSEKTFNIDIIGEIESSIEWETNSDLGVIKPNQPSDKYVRAKSLLYGGRVAYSLESGTLPPGLTFLPNGNIQGKVKQFADDSGNGLTRFFDNDSGTLSYNTTFDGSTSTFDKLYKFTVKAQDGANFSETTREFSINVVAASDTTFANVYVRALQTKTKRLNWFNFITDATIFAPEDIYRYGDNNFGIQTELRSLVFAGVESVEAVKYIQAMSRNHYNKKFTFGNLVTAKAKDPTTQETVYEVIYVELKDNFEKNGKSISDTIELSDNIESKVLVSYAGITIDSDVPLVSDSDLQRVFPNSIINMRNRIKDIGDRDREFLPLWMRSIQDDQNAESGFVKSLTLCYCKPGKSSAVLSRIRASNFDFKTIDFTADRYIIDIIDGNIQDAYLKFPQTNITNHTNSSSFSKNAGVIGSESGKRASNI